MSQAKIKQADVASSTGTGNFVFSASPVLTGTPTAPTQTAGDNTTNISTTAFVENQMTAAMYLGYGLARLVSPVMRRVGVINSAVGHNDIYTCPAGKRAAFVGYAVYNTLSPTVNVYSEINVSGTYYKISITTPVGGFLQGSFPTTGTIILEAGEKISINTAAVGLNIWGRVIEFENTSPIRTVKLTSLTTGDNTLYTCPASTVSFISASSLDTLDNIGFIRYSNSSGGTRTYKTFAVPSGGSSGSTNQMIIGTTLVTDSNVSISCMAGILGAGDFLVFNIDAGTATQLVWVNVIELPA